MRKLVERNHADIPFRQKYDIAYQSIKEQEKAEAILRKNARFPQFINFPIEIRHEIYRHYAIRTATLDYETNNGAERGGRFWWPSPALHIPYGRNPAFPSEDWVPKQLFPSICFVNRAIGLESASYLVSISEFVFTDNQGMRMFTSIMSRLGKLYEGNLFPDVHKVRIDWSEGRCDFGWCPHLPDYSKKRGKAAQAREVYPLPDCPIQSDFDYDFTALLPFVDRCPALRIIKLNLQGWSHKTEGGRRVSLPDNKAAKEIARKFTDMMAPKRQTLAVEVYHSMYREIWGDGTREECLCDK